MIVGVGLDVCEIARMGNENARAMFTERFFNAEERAYVEARGAAAAQSAASWTSCCRT